MNIRLGIFDSGIGGFTVLKSVLERHGKLSCIYLGDNARVPYGEKKPEEMKIIAMEVINWIREQNVTAILIACNTTNSLALDTVLDLAEVPVFGLIESAGKMVKEKRVGVLATPATAISKAYTRHFLSIKPGVFVIEQACPAFVPMIESGDISSCEIRAIANEYLRPLLNANVESIILGCSHYPFLKPILEELIPSNIRLIDPAIGVAIEMDEFLNQNKLDLREEDLFSETRFCVTSDPVGFSSKAMDFLGVSPKVELVSLRSRAGVF